MAGSRGQFLRTERGRPMLCLRGYLYTKHCTNDHLVIFWAKYLRQLHMTSYCQSAAQHIVTSINFFISALLIDRQRGQDWHKAQHACLVDSPILLNYNTRMIRTK